MLDAAASPWTFRPARPADHARLHDVREAAFAPVFESFHAALGPRVGKTVMPQIRAGQAAQLDSLLAGRAGVTVFVVEEQGQVVGFCTTAVDPATRVGEIGLNAVHPDHQRRGIGAWMYRRALDHLRGEGMAVALVETGGDDGHTSARRAYASAGFGPHIPSVVLYRPLDGDPDAGLGRDLPGDTGP